MVMTEAEARLAITGPPEMLARQSFDLLSAIARLHSVGEDAKARDLLLRVLDRGKEFRSAFRSESHGEEAMLRALVRGQGLFPYIGDSLSLGIADQIAYESHRPYGMDDVVFHTEQDDVYQLLAAGENVVLSAPTSFGKSLIIDGVIATGQHRTIVLIVPTIALIDETRRRLTKRFGARYKIVTQAGQPPGERTIYVLTQERFLDIPAERFSGLSFFVIDEFYKLGMPRDDRAPLLNMAFHRLHATGAQFYLLGPNIHDMTRAVYSRLDFQFVKTDYGTVVIDTEILPAPSNLQRAVTAQCRNLHGSTLLYVKEPSRTRTVAKWLIEADLGRVGEELDDASRWIAENYHPEWFLARAVRNGIGVHHGKIPRALGHHLVRLFNEGKLRWLIVTSSLVEGVNTSAKNIVLVDQKIGRQLDLDFFTYGNIRGRSGRMSKHFVGKVLVFGDPPRPVSTTVDIPALSQDADAPLSLLVQLPWNELTAASYERLRPIFEQQAISIKTIRAARGVDPALIVKVAERLHADPRGWSARLAWSGQPDYEQLKSACELVYQLAGSPRIGGVVSDSQLTLRLHKFRRFGGDFRTLVDEQAQSRENMSKDSAIDDVLGFIRDWLSFRVPQYLRILQSITEEVFERYDLPSGNYSHFAATAVALFGPPMTVALEEYGLPAPLTSRLGRFIALDESPRRIDEVLNDIRGMPKVTGLSSFEQDMLSDTISGL
jgi:hypothetical protein